MTKYFIVPGLGNSGPDHWQTHFEQSGNNFERINQNDWESPKCGDWIKTIDDALVEQNLNDVVLIGHSLGCSAIVHWAACYNMIIKGAMLVAPSDPESLQYTFPAEGFAPLPKARLNFRSIVTVSENDIWVTFDRAKYFAQCWGSEFTSIGNAGHINTDSGYGKWARGLEILKTLG